MKSAEDAIDTIEKPEVDLDKVREMVVEEIKKAANEESNRMQESIFKQFRSENSKLKEDINSKLEAATNVTQVSQSKERTDDNPSTMSYRNAVSEGGEKPKENSAPKFIPLFKAQTNEEIMTECASNIGISKITDEDIRYYAGKVEPEDRRRDTSDKVFRSHIYEPARIDVIKEYLMHRMKFRECEIQIWNVRMCRDPSQGIMWFSSHKSFIKQMHQRASYLKDSTIKLWQFSTNESFQRKKDIEKLCQKIREKDPSNIRTQVRPGTSDYEIFIKQSTAHHHNKYVKYDVMTLDPLKQCADFKRRSNIMTETLKEYVANTEKTILQEIKETDEADDDGFKKVTGKRKPSASPEGNKMRKKTKDDDDDSHSGVSTILRMLGYDKESEDENDVDDNITIRE